MNNEERQHTMDFILEQQAQFSSSLQELTGGLQQMKRAIVMLARQFRRERHDLRERIAALVNAQIQAEEITRRNSKDIRALVATTERDRDDISALTIAAEALAAATDRNSEHIRRNSEDISKLLVATERNSENTRRNSEDIGALANIVAQMARRQNGDSGGAP